MPVPPARRPGAGGDGPELDPVLLVSGMGGSILNAWSQKSGRELRVWVRILLADLQFKRNLWSVYDAETGTFTKAIQTPPKICGSPNGPPVTSPRVQLKDGRYLAYRENGVPKEKAKYKIVFIHGFLGCRHDVPSLSQDLAEELGIYLLTFDRVGYGENDPNPKRTEKSTCLDVEELADQLNLGSKFFVIGHSMGGQATWGCLKYIPSRLAGAALFAPAANYWWPGFSANLSRQAFFKQLGVDQWAIGVAHYAPWLSYWWKTQKWFPPSNVVARNPALFSPPDMALFPKFIARKQYEHQITQ